MFKFTKVYQLIFAAILLAVCFSFNVVAQIAEEDASVEVLAHNFLIERKINNPIGPGVKPEIQYDPMTAPPVERIAGARRAPFDFFGTGRTSFATFTSPVLSTENIFWRIRSNGGTETETLHWGRREFNFSDSPAPGYFDGDNKIDVSVFRKDFNSSKATFYVRPSSAPATLQAVQWGLNGDFNSIGDYDGDGRDDFTVTRRANGSINWFILRSSDNTMRAIAFGKYDSNSSDSTMRGADYNGDGRDDLVIKRPDANGAITYYIGDSVSGELIMAQQWGNLFTDTFVTGDYLGDARADFAVWRGTGSNADGVWYIKENGGDRIVAVPFGIPGNSSTDRAIRGDYNGDGKDDIAIYRNRTSTFYWLNSPDLSTLGGFQFGQPGDSPVAGLF